MINEPIYYGDEECKPRMPYGAYGPYEKDFYDRKISWQDFKRLCAVDNYGEGLTKDQLRDMGYSIKD